MLPPQQQILETPRTDLSTFEIAPADMGRSQAAAAAVSTGYQGSLSGLGYRTLKYWALKTGSKLLSPDTAFINKEEFDRDYSLGGKLQFEDIGGGRMPQSLAQEMVNDHIKDALDESRAALGDHTLAVTAGSMAGGLLSPVDFAVNAVLPEFAPLRFGMGASVASRAGTGAARLLSRTANGAINGGAFALMSQPAMFTLSAYTQKPYTLEDAVQNVALGPVIGAAGGALHGAVTHLTGDADRALANAAMHAAMSDKDPTIVRKMAASTAAGKQQAEFVQRARKLFTKEKLTPEESAEIQFMAGPHPDASLVKDGTVSAEALRYATDTAQKNVKRSGRKIIDSILADPSDTRIRAGKSNDELFLAEAWQKLFGVDLRFVDAGLADRMGFNGFIRPSDPTRAYIRAGNLLDQTPQSMMAIAGHELAHTVRTRDPALWGDMVQAMMKTAKDDGGALSNAWASVVNHADKNSVWTGLDIHGKMDETFAQVLGTATTNSQFWQNLHRVSDKSAEKTASFIYRLRSTLGKMLDSRITNGTRDLYTSLSNSLAAADAEGRSLSQKLEADPAYKAKMEIMHEPHMPAFRSMMTRMSDELNRSGRARAEELAQFTEWHDTTFPQVGTLRDDSAVPGKPGRFVTIRRNVRINSDNPGLWVLHTIFKNSKEGTPERELWNNFAKENLNWGQKKEVARNAIQQGPLAQFKRNADGTWDIGIYRNEQFPKWHEVFDRATGDMGAVTRSYFSDSLSEMEARFSEWLTADPEDKHGIGTQDFHDYLQTLTEDEIDVMVQEDPQVLWQGFAEYLKDKTGDDHRVLDPLLKADDNGDFGARKDQAAALQKAWKTFRDKHPEIKQELDARDSVLRTDPTVVERHYADPPVEYFKQMHKDEVARLTAYYQDVIDANNTLEGVPVIPKMTEAITSAISELAHQNIAEKWPNYDRVMKLTKAVDAFHQETISLAAAKKGELPAGYEDVAGLDDVRNPFYEHNLDDAYDFSASPGTDLMADINRKKITLEEANRLAITRQERDHARWKVWATDPVTTSDQLIKQRTEANEIEGWSIDKVPEAAKPAEGEAPKVSGPLETALNTQRDHYQGSLGRLKAAERGKQLDPSDFRDEQIMELIGYHSRQGLEPDQVTAAVAKDLKRYYQSKVIQEINNYEAHRALKNSANQGLDHLYSRLDGSARKGVSGAGASVAEAMHDRVRSDTSPFESALLMSGMQRMFIENDDTLMRAIFSEMLGQSTGDANIKQLADVIKRTQETQIGRLNARGSNIRLLDNYLFSQVHDWRAIKADPAAFMRDLDTWLDWDKTSKTVGFENTPANRETYLASVHALLSEKFTTPPEFDPETMGGNLSNKESLRRTLHFKGTNAYDYDMVYGSGNTAGLLTEQMVKRSERSVIIENFGSDYKKTWGSIMSDLGRAKKWSMEKLGRVDMTFQHIVGDLNHPENASLAAKGRALRNAMNSVVGWMSGVSSLTDIGNVYSTARWAGMEPTELHNKLITAMKEHMSSDSPDRPFLLAQGAGLQAILNSFSTMQELNGPLYKLAQNASDFTFKYNGLEFSSRVFQSAFHDLMTQHLGEMSKAHTPEFAGWLKHYDITEAEWKQMAKHATEVDGLAGTRLAPDLVENEALARKLGVAIADSVHQAVLEPSASDKAILTFGTKAGTYTGEAVRTAMQYKSYPMALVRRINRRFANAYGNDNLYAFGSTMNRAQMEKLVWAGTMVGLATVVLSIKDLMRGREPLNPFDKDQWNLGNAARIISQAGVGPTAVAEQFLSPQQALGPAFGGAYNLARQAVGGTAYGRTNAVMGMLPGASIGPLREMQKAILGSIFVDTYGSQYQRALGFMEHETGQSSIFKRKTVDNSDPQQ